MPHEVDASGNPILRHGRPSPRTLGVTVDPATKEKIYFTKFGTQQLVKDPTSSSGVKQLNVGQTFKGFTTAPVRAFKETFGFSPFGTPTIRDTAYPDLTITKGVGTTTPAPFNGNGNGNGNGKCTLDDHKPLCGLGIGGCCECPNWFTGKVEPCEEKPPNGNGCDVGCLLTGRGCDCGCKDMKPCQTCDSAICKECDAWDIQCEDWKY